MALDGFLDRCRRIINSVQRVLTNNITDDTIETSTIRLRGLILNINRISTRFPTCAPLLVEANEALDIVTEIKR